MVVEEETAPSGPGTDMGGGPGDCTNPPSDPLETSSSSSISEAEEGILDFVENRLTAYTEATLDALRALFKVLADVSPSATEATHGPGRKASAEAGELGKKKVAFLNWMAKAKAGAKIGPERCGQDSLLAMEKVIQQHNKQHLLVVLSALHQWSKGGSMDCFFQAKIQEEEQALQMQLVQALSGSVLREEKSSLVTQSAPGTPSAVSRTNSRLSIKIPQTPGSTTVSPSGNHAKGGGNNLSKHLSPKASENMAEKMGLLRKASDSWKHAVKGVIRRQRRERIRDRDEISPLSGVDLPPRKMVPKSETTRERLRQILGRNFLLGDLEPGLREEIIDAFEDVRVTPGTEIIKQGDIADNFYIIDVGNFDIITMKGSEAPTVTRTKGAEESFGELALMYETPRNATVKATTHALLWAVDRPTFKSIMIRHLTESQTAQVLREVPSLKKLSTRDIIFLADHSKVDIVPRGHVILRAGSNAERVYIVQEGQVRCTLGSGSARQPMSRTQQHSASDAVTVKGRLCILGESMILNREQLSQWSYMASTDTVTLISFDRRLLDSARVSAIRRGLQMQLVSVALQRVPALAELSPDQIAALADTFSESEFPAGTEITKQGEMLGGSARIYVVQSGRIGMYRSGDEAPSADSCQPSSTTAEVPRGTPLQPIAHATSLPTGPVGWGSRFGSLLRAGGVGGSAPGTPRKRSFVGLHSGLGQSSLGATSANSANEEPSSNGSPPGSTDSSTFPPLRSAFRLNTLERMSSDPMPEEDLLRSGGSPKFGVPLHGTIHRPRGTNQGATLGTYGVFGEECLLQGGGKSSYPCHATTVVEGPESAICLSVALSNVTAILGPIQDLLVRSANQRSLRAVPSLDYLTEYEIEMLVKGMGVRRFAPGELIYKAGEPGDCLYVIRKGHVLEMPVGWSAEGGVPMSPGGRPRGEVKVLGKGMFFGDEALTSNEARITNMVAGNGGPGVSPSIGAELYYLDRAVLEANLGPLEELREQRRKNDERRGMVKRIRLEELEEIGLLGTGLFGKVKLVYNKRTKEHYALKCVSKQKVVRMQEEEHLRNEKQLMSELEHPFITKLIRTFKDKDNVYLLQELTTGRELFLFMEKVGRLQEWEAAFYAGAVLLALEYMHSKGIVYRDLKPENTLIAENGYPKLIDMGFAKHLLPGRRTYSMCGTPDYMAPEIIRRQGHGRAVDYWALGCMIYEMITNTSPFNRGDDPPQVVFQRITEGRLTFPSFMSTAAVDITRRLLDPNPETRLGMGKRGTAEIKEHSFFASEINFQLLIRQKEDAPMIPPRPKEYNELCINDDQGFQDDPPGSPVDPSLSHDYWDDIF